MLLGQFKKVLYGNYLFFFILSFSKGNEIGNVNFNVLIALETSSLEADAPAPKKPEKTLTTAF